MKFQLMKLIKSIEKRFYQKLKKELIIGISKRIYFTMTYRKKVDQQKTMPKKYSMMKNRS